METIGDRIRLRRKELGLTQGKLGQLTGLGTATISGLELGTQHGTTKLHKIAENLSCRIEWLETGALPMFAVEGVREQSFVEAVHKKFHDTPLSPEGAEVGAEWEKIEGDHYRQLAKDFIFGLVTAQKNAARRPGAVLTTSSAKGPKTRDRQHKRPDA